MPYYSNYAKDDENQNGAAGQGQASESGVFQRGSSGSDESNSTASASGNSPSSAGAAPGASQKNAANTGSQYQSLDTYLGANADSNFGNKITSKVSDQQAKGYADQGAASNQFQNQVQGANELPTGEQISGAVANPASADASQYQKWMNQTYQGPKNLSDSASVSGNYWNSTKKAVEQTGQLAGNDTGQYSLLNSYFGGPAGSSSYSSNVGPTGQQGLDLSLAQHTAGYGDHVGTLKQGAANLQQKGLQGAQALQNSASAQAGNVEQSANAARSAVGVDANGKIIQGSGAISGLEDSINQGVRDANAKNAELQSTLKSGQLSADQLTQYGIDPTEHTYGNIDLGSYFTPGPALTSANVMTPDQQAQLRALQNLAGVSSDDLASQALSSGTPTGFDLARLQSDINMNKGIYDSAYNSPVSNSDPDVAQAYYGGATPPARFIKSTAQVQQDYSQMQSSISQAAASDPSIDVNNPATWGGNMANIGLAMKRILDKFNNKYNGSSTLSGGMNPKVR